MTTNYILNVILLAGAFLLCVAFYPIHRLVEQIPEWSLQRKWYDLRILILFFIVLYLSCTYYYLQKEEYQLSLIIPAAFFFSAVLVLFVGKLAMETTIEMKWMSVLRHEHVTDHLIGIYNRRYLDNKINEELARVKRYDTPLSMLLLDIDHFKNVNDTYGHQAGDQTLRTLGQLLLKEARDTDIVARYGGEEIAILAVHTPVAEAAYLAERLRHIVETSTMVPADNNHKRPEIKITVSIGVAGIDQKEANSQSFIEQADKALYKAKEQGRNRVVVYE